MTVSIELASIEQKALVAQLLQLYLYDFTEFIPAELNERGLFEYRYLDAYWAPEPDEERFPYVIREDGNAVGFALVRKLNGAHVMSEFFVMRNHRRGGVGSEAVRLVLRALPGKWIIHEHPANVPAQAFWPKVVGELTGGTFEQSRSDDGALTQRFTVCVKQKKRAPLE